MSGRAEQDAAREAWIKEKLKDQPQIVRDYMLSIRKRTSATRKWYLGYLINYIKFMDGQEIKLTEVKPMHIDRYIDFLSETNGDAAINAKLSTITSFYEFLRENDFIIKNPCAGKKLKVGKNDTVIYMTDNEVEEIKQMATSYKVKYRNRDLCIIKLGCSTGMRVSAIRNIDIEDIDFENKSIRVIEKGNRERLVLVGDNTLDSIKTWMSDREKIYGNNEGPLFISQQHNRLSVRSIEHMMTRAAKGIDKHITPHKMRSTCAMNLYNKTGDIYLTADQLGHANIANTTIYAKATEDRRREAANLLD